MRRVNRQDVPAPQVLSSERAQQAYDRLASQIDPNDPSPDRRLPVNDDLIHDPEVLTALGALFRGKCAYCELPVDEDTLDHFRPLRAASNLKERSSSYLHYYWLAYEWRNLYLSCRACNASKRNRFPVKGRRAPVLFSLDEVRDREDALLVDPCVDRPERAFDFNFSGECFGKNDRGRQSIEIFDLNRQKLVSSRAKAFTDAIDLAISQKERFKADLFDPDMPHVGAFEIFARRICARIADHLGTPRPAYGAQLREFVRLVKLIPEDDLPALLHSPPDELRHLAELSAKSITTGYAVPDLRHRRIEGGISRVEIENFKGIDRLVLDIGELASDAKSAAGLMLLADNAAGKTSVLQAIALAVIGPDRADKLKLDRGRLIRNGDQSSWGQSQKRPAYVRVDFHSGETSEIRLDPFSLEFSGLSALGNGLMAYGAHRLLGLRKRRGRTATARVASLFDSRAEVSHPDEWLADERTPFETVARALSDVLVLQSHDKLVRDPQGDVFIQTYGQPTPIDALSDGYRSVIAMAVDVIRWLLQDWPDLETARGIVLIDEVDAHLHPRWKLQIMAALRAAIPQVQFIATTHDPLCLRGMGKGEVVVMKRSFEQRFDLITDLPDFSAMSVEQLLMSDYFGLNTTSDPTVDRALAELADQFSASRTPTDQRLKGTREAFDALMIGASPERQIADEAMLRYLRNRRLGSGEQISDARREAIEAALLAIRASGRSS